MDAPPTPPAAAKGAGKGIAGKLKGHKPVVYISVAALGIGIFFYVRNRQANAAVEAAPDTPAPEDPTSAYLDPIQYSGVGGGVGSSPPAYGGDGTGNTNPVLSVPDGYTLVYNPTTGEMELVAIPSPITPPNETPEPLPGPIDDSLGGLGGGGAPVVTPDTHTPPPAPPPPPPPPPPAQPAKPPRPNAPGWTGTNVFYGEDRHAWYRVVQKPSASHNNQKWNYREYYPPGSVPLIPIGPA